MPVPLFSTEPGANHPIEAAADVETHGRRDGSI